jgi:hypothetical protein
MAKSSLLLLCCTLFACSVWAQKPVYDPAIPQKLTFKKADLGWTANSNYFPRKASFTGGDEPKSILSTEPQKHEPMDLHLPEVKNPQTGIQVKTGHQEPPFRRQ